MLTFPKCSNMSYHSSFKEGETTISREWTQVHTSSKDDKNEKKQSKMYSILFYITNNEINKATDCFWLKTGIKRKKANKMQSHWHLQISLHNSPTLLWRTDLSKSQQTKLLHLRDQVKSLQKYKWTHKESKTYKRMNKKRYYMILLQNCWVCVILYTLFQEPVTLSLEDDRKVMVSAGRIDNQCRSIVSVVCSDEWN